MLRPLGRSSLLLLCNPKEEGLPKVQIVSKNKVANLKDKYNTVIQNLSVIRNGKNTWNKSNRIWSMAILGTDKERNVLFIHSRSPYSVNDFANILLSLPLSLQNAMYLEGGPEASLYVLVKGNDSAKGIEIEKFGSYETGFNENDYNPGAWPIPNVIGVIKRDKENKEIRK
ncbi:MAG: phosphodiester glycosidase family protein [Candidatus Pacearchaeota archaeon]